MKWTLAELAAESGLPPRTIRFYIARGLLPRPESGGRGATYGAEHRDRLQAIKTMQESGKTLAEIARVLDGGGERQAAIKPSAWWRYDIAEDIVVSVRADASPWRLHQVRSALSEMMARLSDPKEREDGNG